MLTQEQLTMMAENVARIRENMASAAREAGRDPADILLCAACKTRTVEEVIASAVLPIDLFGENHVQELVEKTDANAYCGKPGHFIGHLQTNKVNKVVGRAALIEPAAEPGCPQCRWRRRSCQRRASMTLLAAMRYIQVRKDARSAR